MATKKSKEAAGKPVKIEPALERICKKLSDCRKLKRGAIVVRATGAAGGDYVLEASETGVRLAKGPTADIRPVIEIIGDVRRIEGVLAGQKDAMTHFLAGGFRVRGDLRYFSDLGLELGILKRPL